MNIKINKAQHLELCKLNYQEFLFGSRLHETNNEKSDYDYVRLIDDDFYNGFDTIALFLPNIHNFQYDDVENNTQYIWMTIQQFYSNLFSGDGHVASDIILFNKKFSDNYLIEDTLFLTRTYKNIKGYLGLAKRDMKFFNKSDKKKFHTLRGLYIADSLINNNLPDINYIKELKKHLDYEHLTLSAVQMKLDELRKLSNSLYESNDLTLYPVFKERNSLIQLLTNANNIKEFKYD